jgi:hypothetical protein
VTQHGKDGRWTVSALAFVVVCAVLYTLTSRYVARVADLVEANYGYVANPEGTREFLRELDQPLFRQAGAEVIAGAKGKDAYLYRYADRCHRQRYGKPFKAWNQGSAGTCVSFGWAGGSYVGQCVDHVTGELAECPLLVDTSSIYGGSRTAGRMPPVANAGWSDGSYGGAAARWVSGRCKVPGIGGILYCQKYGNTDLTTYSIDRSRQWGCYGVPADLAKEAHAHTARAVALCEDWQSLTAALESGMAVPICSNVGFASGDRDADGFCRRASTWNHCMVCISVKYASNNGPGSSSPMKNPRDGVLVLNSWGVSLGGGKHPSDQPDGTFWITRADAEAILAQGDSFVIGSVSGFKYRDLDHGAWLQPAAVPASTDEARSQTINHYLAL